MQSAIQAEAQADPARRQDLLNEAIAADQGNAGAHWQLGQVHYQGQWLPVENVAERAGHDKALADYRQMRAKFGDSEEAQRVRSPAACQKYQLNDAARAHATRLHEMQPDDAERPCRFWVISWYFRGCY